MGTTSAARRRGGILAFSGLVVLLATGWAAAQQAPPPVASARIVGNPCPPPQQHSAGCPCCSTQPFQLSPIQLPPALVTGVAAVDSSDEYLCDGGDRGNNASVGDDWAIRGLEVEDTIGHYDTLDGQRLVSSSNRVCIYAPRFAAVRSLSGAIAANKFDAPITASREVPSLEMAHDDRTATTLQNVAPGRNIGVVVVDSVRDQLQPITADNTLVPAEFSSAFKAYEDYQLIRTGEVDNAEKARLAINVVAAKTWESDLGVQVTVGGQRPLVVRDVMLAMEERGASNDDKPKLRLVKVASRSYARPGDEVEFTLRFDNIGTQAMGNVTIVDNLTTRLELVPESTECSVASEFKTETNAVGSQILRWEITDPLAPQQGGIIRFTCRVR